MDEKIEHTKSTGNVYADLGFRDADKRLVKAQLASKINQILEKRKLLQVEIGEILGINQPKVSALINGRLADFSIERLMEFLTRLDQDVKIMVSGRPKKKRRSIGRFQVGFA